MDDSVVKWTSKGTPSPWPSPGGRGDRQVIKWPSDGMISNFRFRISDLKQAKDEERSDEDLGILHGNR